MIHRAPPCSSELSRVLPNSTELHWVLPSSTTPPWNLPYFSEITELHHAPSKFAEFNRLRQAPLITSGPLSSFEHDQDLPNASVFRYSSPSPANLRWASPSSYDLRRAVLTSGELCWSSPSSLELHRELQVPQRSTELIFSGINRALVRNVDSRLLLSWYVSPSVM